MRTRLVPATQDGFGCIWNVGAFVVLPLEPDNVLDRGKRHDRHEFHFFAEIPVQQFKTLKAWDLLCLDFRANLVQE